MKSLSKMINERNESFFRTIQTESTKGAMYTTIDTSKPMSDYKHGFLSHSQYNDAIFLVAFNNIEELQELLDTDDDEYSKLLNMKPQDTKTVRGELFVKLW